MFDGGAGGFLSVLLVDVLDDVGGVNDFVGNEACLVFPVIFDDIFAPRPGGVGRQASDQPVNPKAECSIGGHFHWHWFRVT